MIGIDKARQIGKQVHRMQRHVPLAKKLRARMLALQRHTIADIARTLRTTDVSVRGWRKARAHG